MVRSTPGVVSSARRFQAILNSSPRCRCVADRSRVMAAAHRCGGGATLYRARAARRHHPAPCVARRRIEQRLDSPAARTFSSGQVQRMRTFPAWFAATSRCAGVVPGRPVQEGCADAIKHSRTAEVDVHFVGFAAGLLCVSPIARRVSRQTRRRGPAGTGERVQSISGSLLVHMAPGGGVRTAVRVGLEPSGPEASFE